MKELIFIALGGAAGAVLRYAVAHGADFVYDGAFPWGTLAANLLGCLAIGFLWTWVERTAPAPELAAFVLVGLLGAFTTFSTYALESVRLLQGGELWRGALYLLSSNAAGLALVLLGMAAARRVFSSAPGA